MAAVETLEDLTDEQLRAVDALPQGSALLMALRGSDRGARYLLDSDSVVAGRSPDCDIFLDDITVSRQHCVFLRAEGQLTVDDQGSLNGTYVNRALTDGPVVLRAGDEVQIGKFRLVFYPSPHGLG
jgi:pSer/pThr/pTyr-binding forkhead associated (FHA) protein